MGATRLALLHLHGRAGVMPIMTYGGFKRMTGFCKTAVPPQIAAELEAIKDNEDAVKVWLFAQSLKSAWG